MRVMRHGDFSLNSLIIFLLATHFSSGVDAARTQAYGSLIRSLEPPPAWPDSYSLSYTYTLPYTSKIQPDPISYPVNFARYGAGKHSKVRMDTYNGTNLMILTRDGEYELIPQINVQSCLVFAHPDDSAADMHALPDLTGWSYIGASTLSTAGTNQEAQLWQYLRHHEAKTVDYRFYVSLDGTPLRLHMQGTEAFTGAHFDEWVVDYTSYEAGEPSEELFEMPEQCEGVPPSDLELSRSHSSSISPARLRMGSLLPIIRYGGHADYDNFLATIHGVSRRHRSLVDYHTRAQIFTSNADKITAHNAAAAQGKHSYTLGMNKFGDWTREEFLVVMLPKKSRAAAAPAAAEKNHQYQYRDNNNVDSDTEVDNSGLEDGMEGGLSHRPRGKYELEYQALTDPDKVPSAVDWRGTGADVVVKDQANCGSCWAFGATGTMEGAWFKATGQRISLSEQQIIDCSWGFVPKNPASNSACDGGDAWAAVGYIVEAGGIASTTTYEYLGQGNYCKPNIQPAAKFKGYARVPRGDDLAVMEALYSRGPLAVSIDASQDSFTFYSSGVYYETKCMWKPADLDHSVLLVGYGSDVSGDYWLIKNSWSEHWGDDGYVKIARDGGGCGVASDAMYAVVDVDDVFLDGLDEKSVSK